MVLQRARSGKVPKVRVEHFKWLRDLCHVAPHPFNSVLLVYYYAFFRYDFHPKLHPTSYRCTGSIRAPV